jgi:tetratricopeptide (TPR) repeat protein
VSQAEVPPQQQHAETTALPIIKHPNTLPASAPFLRRTPLIGVGIATALALASYFAVTLRPISPTDSTSAQPRGARELYNQGIDKASQKDYQGALADYTRSLQIDSQDPNIYYSRALIYVELGEYEKAIADYSKAIDFKYNPLSIPYYNRAIAYRYKQDVQAAISDFNKSLLLDPNYADAYFDRANAYSSQGEREKAIADYKKAAELYQKKGNTKNYQKALQAIKNLGQ